MQHIRAVRGHYGGGFGSYSVPLSSEFGALSITNEITLAVSDAVTLYNDGAGTNLGFDLRDVNTGYFILVWNSGAIFATGGDVAGRQAADIREGDTASSVAAGGTLLTNSNISHNAPSGPIDYLGGFWAPSRPSGLSSEFGFHFHDSTSTASRSRVHGATLLVLPSSSSLFSGSTLGKVNSTWSTANPGSITYNNQVLGDEDQTITANFTVGTPGTYLVLTRTRPTSGASACSLRWAHKIDNVDLWSVRTDTATAGATRTGRGFQVQFPSLPSAASPYFTSAQVVTLAGGSHTFAAVGNRHEVADGGESLSNNIVFVVNTGMFRQFKYAQVTATQTAPTSSSWALHSAFTQSITIDGTAKLLLIFHTTAHENTSSGILGIRIKRDGVVITPSGVDAGSQPFPRFSGYAVLNGTNGTADSDNNTLPYSIIWVDNPGAGTFTYTIESADQGTTSSALWNTNDNGAAGFKGLFAIAELAFARVGF